MHDFTIYSPGSDAYAAVRLAAEFKLDSQVLSTTKHVQILWLHPLETYWTTYWKFGLANILFYLILAYLVIDEILCIKNHLGRADIYMKEGLVEHRLNLKLNMLTHSAFNKLGQFAPYKPLQLVDQLTRQIAKIDTKRSGDEACPSAARRASLYGRSL